MVSGPEHKPLQPIPMTEPGSTKTPGKENQLFENSVRNPQGNKGSPIRNPFTKVREVLARDSKNARAASRILSTPLPSEDPAKTKLDELKTQFSFDINIDYTPQTTVATGAQTHLEAALLTLISCQRAAKRFAYNSDKVKAVLASLDLDNPSKQFAKDIKKAFFDEIPSKDFLTSFEIERGKLLPATLEHTFEVGNQQFEEKRKFIDNWASVAYLETFGDTYRDQIRFIQENSVRNGPLKAPSEAQGMLLNGQVHTLTKGSSDPDTVLRSGAFCVHGDMPDKARLHLSVAQALAKITKGIELIVNNPAKLDAAMDAGELLYVEQSFLSTADSSERKMCEEMKAAMDYLAKHAEVHLSPTHQGVRMEKGKLIITIQKPIAGQFKFHLRPILFVEGVNEKQSLGQLLSPKAIKYQETLNQEARQSLLEYAEKCERTDQISAFTTHFSNNTERESKDIEGVHVVRDAVEALGGVRGISCKTGKDRTGAEVSDTLASNVEKSDQKKKSEIRDSLAGGISYHITGQNTGKQNAYAFNSLQYQFLPKEWRPPKQYCGDVPS